MEENTNAFMGKHVTHMRSFVFKQLLKLYIVAWGHELTHSHTADRNLHKSMYRGRFIQPSYAYVQIPQDKGRAGLNGSCVWRLAF